MRALALYPSPSPASAPASRAADGGGALQDCSILQDGDADNVTAMAEEERERHFESKVLLRMQLKALRRQVR